MPIRKKKNTKRSKIIIVAVILAILALMLITFPATQNLTEVALF